MTSPSSGRHARPRTPVLRGTAAAAGLTAAGLGAGLIGATGAEAATTTSTYTVVSGDTLSGIAAREHVPSGWRALAAHNHIRAPYTIRPGEKLVLPIGSHLTRGPVTIYLSPFPVAVAIPTAVGNVTQVITVQASGSYASVIAWQKTGDTWNQVYSTTQARVGANGITEGDTRVQGTDTTPTGTYTITQGFGVATNPGTKMPYHQVTTHDWWVEDPTSAYYNQMRTDTQGGFHLTESGDDSSEHLINYPTQYHNALVINFNTNPAVKGRGAGIFLHDLGPQHGPTAGCVAVPQQTLTQIMQWIDPTQHPVIAIG